MDNFNCLICGCGAMLRSLQEQEEETEDNTIHKSNDNNIFEHVQNSEEFNSSNYTTLWRLLDIDISKYKWMFMMIPLKSSMLCPCCQKRIEQVQQVMNLLEELQCKLDTWHKEIQAELLSTNELRGFHTTGLLDRIRSKIVSDLYSCNRHESEDNVTSDSIYLETPDVQVDGILNVNGIPPVPPSSGAQTFLPYEDNNILKIHCNNKDPVLIKQPIHKQSNSLSDIKQLKIPITRIDDIYPNLKIQQTIRINPSNSTLKENRIESTPVTGKTQLQKSRFIKNSSVFKCIMSEFHTSVSGTLDLHLKLLNSNNFGFKCYHCPERFCSKMKLLKHEQSQHQQLTQFEFVQCPHCPRKCLNEKTLKSHLIEVHDKKGEQFLNEQLPAIDKSLEDDNNINELVENNNNDDDLDNSDYDDEKSITITTISSPEEYNISELVENNHNGFNDDDLDNSDYDDEASITTIWSSEEDSMATESKNKAEAEELPPKAIIEGKSSKVLETGYKIFGKTNMVSF